MSDRIWIKDKHQGLVLWETTWREGTVEETEDGFYLDANKPNSYKLNLLDEFIITNN
jgi:hypothetical protein